MTLVQPKEIWKVNNGKYYDNMRGPCNSGYHIPMASEISDLRGKLTNLNMPDASGERFRKYLKMPYTGYATGSGKVNAGTDGYYVCADFSGILTNTKPVKELHISTTQQTTDNFYLYYGYNIRPFRNTITIPDNTWTTLYDGSSVATGAGIFHNSSLGIISVSSDGVNWQTIADKNLGATAVYNDGDTLSQTNCGRFYQRGNNYGFWFAGGTYTTSANSIDPTDYGPRNLYSSSTFITSKAVYEPRNSNMWGGDWGPNKRPVKEVYIGSTKVRPALKTFTVTFTETSSPSSFNPVYSDDAAGLTAGSTAFDEFFGYSAVRLNTSGVETAEITQAQSGGAGKLDITQLGTLTSGDNVMIKFPVRGIKMTKNGRTITLSITKETGRESEGYQYYAFQKTGDIEANASATVATSPLYLGTYLSYTDGSTLKSWSGKTPQGNYTMGNAITYAGNNGTGYTITGFYQRELINAYYMMKYGNPDCQSVIGRGFVDGNSAAAATGGTNSQTNATYGESTGKYSVKLFGLEDWRGNQHQRVGGMFTNASKNMWTALHDFTASISTSESQYKNAGAISHSGSYYDISSILGSNKGMFAPTATVNNSNYDTYWCDSGYVNASRLAVAGGDWNDGSYAGAFLLDVSHSASAAYAGVGARLMFI